MGWVDGMGQQMDVLVLVIVVPQPEDVDGLRHETMHNSSQCCGSGHTCYRADRMSKDSSLMTLLTDVADDSSVTPAIQIWAGSCPMHDNEAGHATV